MSTSLVPVYRKFQPTMISPCTLGAPCPACRAHAPCRDGRRCKRCRRGKPWECERASPAAPAFLVKAVEAIRLVRDGLASFIHHNTALQLNYAKLTHLRDKSSRVDPSLVFEYVIGVRSARVAINLGWGRAAAAS